MSLRRPKSRHPRATDSPEPGSRRRGSRHLVSALLPLVVATGLLVSASLLTSAPAALDAAPALDGTVDDSEGLVGSAAAPPASPDLANPDSAPSDLGPSDSGSPEPSQTATVPLIAGADTTEVATVSRRSSFQRKKKPNVLLITTDDQTLTDLRAMPTTRKRIGGMGVRFTGLAPHPLCCPARALMLTGQHAQNNGVRTNSGPFGGYKRLNPRRTVGAWMNRAGYRTIYLGKFLNGYGPRQAKDATPGWNDWNATVRGVYNANRYTVNHNGRLRAHTRHQTDYFTDLAVRKIEHNARNSRRPFFLWQSYVAPHTRCSPQRETRSCWQPPTPAKRHRKMFGKARPPAFSKASYNERDVSDKPRWIRTKDRLTKAERPRIRHWHRERLRSLRSVDEGIGRMLNTLARTKQLRNTLIIFTSDNGFLLGEHRDLSKTVPYEESVRVPFLMRGPGIPKGRTRHLFATHADIAPTIAAIGRTRPGRKVDGRNLLPAARRGAPTYDTVLIQGGPHRKRYTSTGWFYRGVRTQRYTYAHYPRDNEHELYDRRHDPLQLRNVANDVRYVDVVADLQRRLHQLKSCAGVSCRTRFGPDPRPARGTPELTVPTAYRYVDRR